MSSILTNKSKIFRKRIAEDAIQLEAELQSVSASHGFSPKIDSVSETHICMEDLQSPCLADEYGDDPNDIPEWIWMCIRDMLTTLYEVEGIEYVDITPYNFILKGERVYVIDFGHAYYRKCNQSSLLSQTAPENWFLRDFLDGQNSWNPDFK